MKNNKGRKLFAGMALLFVCSLATGVGTKIVVNNRLDASVVSSYASVAPEELNGCVAVAEIAGREDKSYYTNGSEIFNDLSGETGHVDLYILDDSDMAFNLDLTSLTSLNMTIHIVKSDYSALGGNYFGSITIPSGATVTLGSGVFYGSITNNGTLKLSSNASFDEDYSITTSSAIDANGYTGDLTMSMTTITSGTVVITNYTSGTITVSDLTSGYSLNNESGSLTIRQAATITFINTATSTNLTPSSSGYVGCLLPEIGFSAPTRENYTFKGFYTQTNGGGIKYYNADLTVVSAITVPSATLTLYTYWEENVVETNYTLPTAKANLKYTGNAQELVNDGACEGGDIEYSLDGSVWDTSLPTGTAVSTYTIYYRVVKNSNTIAQGNFNVAISKGDASVSVAPTAKTLTFTGANQDLVNAGTCSNGSFQYKVGDGEWSASIPQAMNVGTYTVYWKVVGDANYNDVAGGSISVNISKADLVITTGNVNKVYDTNSTNLSSLITAVKDVNNVDVATYSIFFGEEENLCNQTDISVKNVADSGTYYYEISYDTENYNIAKGNITVTIDKASVNEPTEFASKNYNNTNLKPDVSSELYFVVSEYINAGTYDVELQLTDPNNYKWTTQNNSSNYTLPNGFTINKIAMSATTGSVCSGLTYNSAEQDLVSGFSVTGGEVVFKINGVETNAIATNAGNYEIYYKFIADANHTGSTSYTLLGTASIAKYEVTLKATTSINGYTGSVFTLEETYDESSSDSVLSGHRVVVKYGVAGAGISITNVSESIGELDFYSVQILDASDNDVTDNYNVTKEKGSFIISPVDLVYTAPTEVDVPFNNSNQALIISGSCANGTFYYSLDESSWNTEIPTAKDAGNYTVYWKIVANNSNYNDVSSQSVESTISAANASMIGTIKAKSNLIYNGNSQTLVELSNNFEAVNGTLKFSFDNINWSTDLPKRVNADTYTFWYKIEGDIGCVDTAETQMIVSIAKADVSLTEPSAKDLTYNDEKQELVTSGVCEDGEIQFSIDNESWSTDIPVGYDAGDYDVYYRVIGDANHNDKPSTQIINVKIKKADPSFVAPTCKELTYTGVEQELINAGSTSHGTIKYSLDNETWYNEIPSGCNADSYTIYYKVLGDANHNNYTNSINVSISNAEITNVNVVGLDIVYDGEEHNIATLATADTLGDNTENWLFSEDGYTWVNTIVIKNVSESNTYYYKVSADNHNEKSGSFEVSISKKDITVTAKTEEYKYNGENQFSTGYGSINGLCDNQTAEVYYDLNSVVKNVSDGTVDNIISLVAIKDAENEDVSYNYNVSTINGTIKIIARTLCVEAFSETKEYDGTALTNSNINSNFTNFDGLIGSHNIVVEMDANSTITDYSENGVENIISSITIFDNEENDVTGNYEITKKSGLLKITQRQISIGDIQVLDKEYDGSKKATISGAITLNNVIYDDIENVSLLINSITFADKNVGENKAISLSGVFLTGSKAQNYKLISCSTNATASITEKQVVIMGTTVQNKVYDSTTTAEILNVGSINGLINSDNVNIEIGNANFDTKDVGRNKQVVFTDFALTGSDAGNYILSAQPINAVANITAKELMVSGISVENKIYDGTTDTLTTGYLNLDGIVEGDGLLWTINSIRFADKNAGDNKQIVVDIVLDGLNKDNYIICEPNLTANIVKKSVYITGITVDNKFYDGTTIATISGTPILSEVIAGDDVHIAIGRVRFIDEKIGFNKPVMFSNFGIYGIDAKNYELIGQPESATASILAVYSSEDEDSVKFAESELKKGVDISTIFENARTEENEVIIDLGDKGQIIFNSDAVNEIAGNNVVLKINEVSEITENIEKSGLTPELTLEINMSNVSFEDGKATISYDFEKGVPFGKNLKVYYIDLDGNKTDMSANYKDGKIIFDTNHFSTYVVVYETNVGLIGGLAGGAVVLLAGGIFTICWFTRKKKNK